MKIFSATLKGTTTVSQGTTNLSGSFTGSYSGSVAGIAGDISDYSSSVALRTTSLEAASGSFSTRTTSLEAASGSFSTRTTSLEAASGSFSTRTTAIERVYATTGSNTFTAAQIIQGTLTAQTLVVQTVTSSVLFSTGSNKIGSSLSNVQELTGSVGITGSLAINGTGAIVGSGTANYVPKFTASGTIGNSQIFDNGTNVGIGTASPSYIIDAYSTSSSAARINIGGTTNFVVSQYTNTSGTMYVGIDDSAGANFTGTAYGRFIYSSGAYPFIFNINGSERMRITSDGNVGIGTSSPNISGGASGSTALTISATASGRNGIIELKGTRTASGQISSYIRSFSNSGATPGVDLVMYRGTADTDGELAIATSGTERMRITSAGAGNIGIGTTTPGAQLVIAQPNANFTTVHYLTFRNLVSGYGTWSISKVDDNNLSFNYGVDTDTPSAGYNMKLRYNAVTEFRGNVLIGNTTVNTSVALQAYSSGTTSATYPLSARNSAGTDNFYIRSDGFGYLQAASWSYGSDRRIKENINYIETGLDKVLALKPATFDYIDGVKNNIGWIAQDVQEVIPEAVGVLSETNNQLTLKSEFIIPYLVKAVQQQQSQIEELKTLLKA